MLRRIMVLPMTVDASLFTGGGTYFTTDIDRHAEWIAKCIRTRMSYSAPPVSTRALLMTLCGKSYDSVMMLIKILHNPPLHYALRANCILRSKLMIDIDELSSILYHYYKDYRVTVFDKHMVANIVPV
jgi:hypothetical protein